MQFITTAHGRSDAFSADIAVITVDAEIAETLRSLQQAFDAARQHVPELYCMQIFHYAADFYESGDATVLLAEGLYRRNARSPALIVLGDELDDDLFEDQYFRKDYELLTISWDHKQYMVSWEMCIKHVDALVFSEDIPLQLFLDAVSGTLDYPVGTAMQYTVVEEEEDAD